MTAMDEPARRRHVLQRYSRWGGPVPSRTEEMTAMSAYLGVIVTGPVFPLVVYLGRRHTSRFIRYHCAQAVNVGLTGSIYAVCCAILGLLLSADSAATALAVSISIAVIGWLLAVRHLAQGATAASRGEYHEIPAWICTRFVR